MPEGSATKILQRLNEMPVARGPVAFRAVEQPGKRRLRLRRGVHADQPDMEHAVRRDAGLRAAGLRDAPHRR